MENIYALEQRIYPDSQSDNYNNSHREKKTSLMKLNFGKFYTICSEFNKKKKEI